MMRIALAYFPPRHSTTLPPHLSGNLDNELQLSPLIGIRDFIAVKGTGEPTLRGKAEVLKRRKVRRRINAPLERFFRLHPSDLCRHQSEHHALRCRQQLQRLKSLPPIGIELHEKTIDIARKERFDDLRIAA